LPEKPVVDGLKEYSFVIFILAFAQEKTQRFEHAAEQAGAGAMHTHNDDGRVLLPPFVKRFRMRYGRGCR